MQGAIGLFQSRLTSIPGRLKLCPELVEGLVEGRSGSRIEGCRLAQIRCSSRTPFDYTQDRLRYAFATLRLLRMLPFGLCNSREEHTACACSLRGFRGIIILLGGACWGGSSEQSVSYYMRSWRMMRSTLQIHKLCDPDDGVMYNKEW
jgi:hypothetical protein